MYPNLRNELYDRDHCWEFDHDGVVRCAVSVSLESPSRSSDEDVVSCAPSSNVVGQDTVKIMYAPAHLIAGSKNLIRQVTKILTKLFEAIPSN